MLKAWHAESTLGCRLCLTDSMLQALGSGSMPRKLLLLLIIYLIYRFHFKSTSPHSVFHGRAQVCTLWDTTQWRWATDCVEAVLKQPGASQPGCAAAGATGDKSPGFAVAPEAQLYGKGYKGKWVLKMKIFGHTKLLKIKILLASSMQLA